MSFPTAASPPGRVSPSLKQNSFWILPSAPHPIEIFRNAASTFLRFFDNVDMSVRVAELDAVSASESDTVIASIAMRSTVIQKRADVSFFPFDEPSKNDISDELCAFIDRMGWRVQKTLQDASDDAIALCDRLKNHSSPARKPKPVWIYAGSAASVQATCSSWLPAIEAGTRVLFVANGVAEPLRLELLAAGVDLTQAHVYVAELAPLLDDPTVKAIAADYASHHGAAPDGLFWDILAAIDRATNAEVTVSRFTRTLRFVRCDADNLSSVAAGSGLASPAIARDFATILTARKLLMGKAGQTLAQSRDAAARWVKNFAEPISQRVEISVEHQHLRIYKPDNANGRHLIYLHGGGLVYYDLDVFAAFMSQIAASTGFTVLAFGYDKLPETSVDIVLDGLLARIREALPDSQEPVIMGDSIGGLLALYAAIGPFRGTFSKAVLLYPVIAFNETYPAYEVYGENYLLDASMMRWFRSMCSPYFKQRGFDPMKLTPADLAGLQLSVFSAGCDVLADEADAFAKLVSASYCQFTEMPHDFCLYGGKIASTQAPIATILNSLMEMPPAF